MKTLSENHRHAMDLAEEAFVARRRKEWQRARTLFEQAFTLERSAADELRDDLTMEPSRSVLYRSAASLAVECGKWQEAEELISAGLSGNPPAEIAEELRQLRDVAREKHRGVAA